MRSITRSTVAAGLALALATVPLTGCLGGKDKADDRQQETKEAVDGAVQEDEEVDIASWKTLADAFAASAGDPSYGYDENHYVAVLTVGERSVHVVATMTPEVFEAVSDIDITQDGYQDKMSEALSPLVVESATDITDEAIPQEELDALIGKTGQEIMDAGFSFSSYMAYGGDETTAIFDKGYYAYEFTFPVRVAEDATEDGGAALRIAVAKNVISNMNISNDALDPTKVDALSGADQPLATEADIAAGAQDEVANETVDQEAGEAPTQQ